MNDDDDLDKEYFKLRRKNTKMGKSKLQKYLEDTIETFKNAQKQLSLLKEEDRISYFEMNVKKDVEKYDTVHEGWRKARDWYKEHNHWGAPDGLEELAIKVNGLKSGINKFIGEEGGCYTYWSTSDHP
jgi:hypothetical protein